MSLHTLQDNGLSQLSVNHIILTIPQENGGLTLTLEHSLLLFDLKNGTLVNELVNASKLMSSLPTIGKGSR